LFIQSKEKLSQIVSKRLISRFINKSLIFYLSIFNILDLNRLLRRRLTSERSEHLVSA